MMRRWSVMLTMTETEMKRSRWAGLTAFGQLCRAGTIPAHASGPWAPSTRETNLYHLNGHILPALGEHVLCNLENFHCQVFLNGLAEKGFPFTIVDHCRIMLKRY
jgi:hypothetical protein